MIQSGFHTTALAAMPSFTNPNNVSIITGVPPAVHGIAGNYYLDPDTGNEVMVTDDSLMRGSTILAEMAAAGVRVAAITAKDKLRKILLRGLRDTPTMCFSAERAPKDVLSSLDYGSAPNQYSPELSLFVLDAGVKLLEEKRVDLMYLTLSDYVQHKHAPGTEDANEFMAAIDERVKRLIGLGAVVGMTGDHGMSDKCNAEGKPNVLFLQDELERRFGQGCARVICPIADPFVKHHGALGSFVRVHVADRHVTDPQALSEYARSFSSQVELVLLKEDAARLLEMPMDREGDFVVVAREDAVIGSKEEEHDLASLGGFRLRSHGGFSEQEVPLMMSTAIHADESEEWRKKKKWRNFDVFDLVLNHGQ